MIVDQDSVVRKAELRGTAQVRLGDGTILEAPLGTRLESFVQAAWGDEKVPIIAALVNGELRELTYPVQSDASVEPLRLSSSDGVRIYRRSLAFLLVTIVHELFPEASVFVDHTLPFGGFFCRVLGRDPFSPSELATIDHRMRQVVAADAPIERTRVPLGEAIAMFHDRGEEEKVRLLSRRQRETISLYTLLGRRDYFHGYMTASTGYLRYFALRPWPQGFVLRYPRRSSPTVLQPAQDFPQLTAIFRQYGEWLRLLGVNWVSGLNEAASSSRIREIILVSEALHEERIAHIANAIAAHRGQVRVVLIAGPSASGKTTFAKRLSIQLLAHGVHPYPLALDDYFVEREDTPRDADGNYDFESFAALDVPLLNQQLLALMRGDRVALPHFNFRTGKREAGDTVQLQPEQVVLIEGIHALNPQLARSLAGEQMFRIFVSALTQLNIDRHNRVPTTDTRLIRRIVRDATYRGYSAEQTLERWESVRRGEKKHIFPYQERADVMFNSALPYELAVLKPLVEPLLLQVDPRSPRRVEVKRLLAFLGWVADCGSELVPDNSLLREFIGGSILRDYRPRYLPAGRS